MVHFRVWYESDIILSFKEAAINNIPWPNQVSVAIRCLYVSLSLSVKSTPNMVLDITTLRSRVACFPD